MPIDVFYLGFISTVMFVRQGDDWYLVNFFPNGWDRRRPWYPTEGQAKVVAREENRIKHPRWYLKHMYGIPYPRTAS